MNSSPQDAQPGRKGFSRIGLYAPFALLALFIVVWSAVWALGARRVGTALDDFIAREAARGHDWLCPQRSISGYPFRLELQCTRPQIVEKTMSGQRREVSLAGLSIHGRVTAPGQYIATLDSPMNMRLDGERDVTLRWASARASFRAGSGSLAEFSLEVMQPEAMLGPGEPGDERIRAKDVALHFRRSPGEALGSDLLLRVGEISQPALDRLLGIPEPLTLEIQASAPGLMLDPARRIETVLEEWRLANGQARVVLAKATKGAAAIDLSGVLGLDAERRLVGNLQGRARGADPILSGITRRMGLEIGGLLGRFGGGQGLPVVLVAENGRLRFGPFQLMRLDPLY